MITGMKKKDKITEIFSDEDNPIINIRTYNTDPETLTAEPILFRWIGNAEWINKQLKKLGMKLFFTNSIEQFKEQF